MNNDESQFRRGAIYHAWHSMQAPVSDENADSLKELGTCTLPSYEAVLGRTCANQHLESASGQGREHRCWSHDKNEPRAIAYSDSRNEYRRVQGVLDQIASDWGWIKIAHGWVCPLCAAQ